MAGLTRFVWTDDDGSGFTGSIIDNAELQKIFDASDAELKSASNPSVTTKSIQDNYIGGRVRDFGGAPDAIVTDTAYPVGTTGDKLHEGTSVWNVDSKLLTGTFRLEGMLYALSGTTVTVILVNLTDASETALATLTTTSVTPLRRRSGTITFAAGGTAKDYAIKIKVSGGNGGAYELAIVRTA